MTATPRTETTCLHRRTVASNLGRYCSACNTLVEAGQGLYRSRKVEDDGYTFDSVAEHGRYCELRAQLRAGELTWLAVHPKYALAVDGAVIRRYTADFEYRKADGTLITEDVKSAATRKARDWPMTRKLFRACYGRSVLEVIR